MNGIIGMSHLLAQTTLDNAQSNYLNKIDVDLFKVVEQVVNINEFKAHDKGLELVVDYDMNLGKEFYGDSLRISQILTNLLSNAIKFTDSGEIKIVIKNLQNNRARFEVIDSGIGLSEEQQRKLFQEFSQADGSTTRKYGGTGLGLAISKKLVELMDGKIWVESELNHGSVFVFEIELIKKEKEQNTPITIFKNKKALIVDDTKSWQDVLGYLLNSFGFETKIVSNEIDAINIIKSEYFDIVFMDWNMPNMNGIQIIKKIKKEHNTKLEFILISAYEQQNIINSAKEVGVEYFIPKPINPSILNNTLSDILLGTHKLRENLDSSKIYANLKKDITTLRGSKILLVEDNKTNQEIILGLLENSGIIIDIANDGIEAIEKYKQYKDYELILMDLQMPNMDGYSATKIIREKNKDIPIIALTANAMREDIAKTQAVGMNKHLNKPIEVDKLYETLLEFISKKANVIDINIPKDNKEDISLPEFDNIDSKSALKLVMENKKIFIDILKGLYEYKDIALEEMSDDEFKRTTHTIKGISASAGASALHKIAKEIDETGDKNLLGKLYEELKKVTDEIEQKIINTKEHTLDKMDLQATKRDELFLDLKNAIATKRAKNCKPIIQEIDKYHLNSDDSKLFDNIKRLIKKFKFKDALELL
jgi:CheY-like chemotaxis protein